MAEPLIGILKRASRIVIAFWPALLAWFLFGVLGNFLIIQAAGWVGASHFGLGIALMPFAILCRLIAFVAMLLTARKALPNLTSTSPEPTEPRQRRRQFIAALLAGILPFFAFYLAWGFMRNDMAAYYVQVDRVLGAAEPKYSASGDVVINGPLGLSLTWLTGIAIAVTFVARRLLKRFSTRSSRVVPVVSVYLEALWVMLAALVLANLTESIGTWFNERQGIAWLTAVRSSIAVHVAPIDWALTVSSWVIGEVGGLILLPLAWLTIAGVIYGETLAPSSPAMRFLQRGRLSQIRERVGRLPGWLHRRLNDLWNNLVGSLQPIGDAFKLMWHAGPLLIAIYVLAFRGVEWISAELDVAIVGLVGPHPTDFWITYSPVLALIGPTLTAPVTVGVVAAAFDLVIGRLRTGNAGSAELCEDVSPPGQPPVASAEL